MASDRHHNHRHHHHGSHRQLGFFSLMMLRFFLKRWRGKTSFDGHKDLYVKRRFEANRVCVDLYWNIHRKSDGQRIGSTDTRVSWESIKSEVSYVEKQVLPALLNE